jgi:hypothetical protein
MNVLVFVTEVFLTGVKLLSSFGWKLCSAHGGKKRKEKALLTH